MIEHHLQRNIVYRLAFTPRLKFSDLQPDGVENKLFDYHLKKVIKQELVEKDSSGLYQLTHVGRRVGIDAAKSGMSIPEKAHSVLFLAVQRKADGAWLLYRRKVHPLLHGVGYMHAEPREMESVLQTATKVLRCQTGLNGRFRVLGGGYFRVYDDNEIESFTHFTLLVCNDAVGTLQVNDEFADYFWDNSPEFNAASMLPNMAILTEKVLADQQFFIEQTF